MENQQESSTTTTTEDVERGSCKLTVYLDAVTAAEAESLAEALADVLVARGIVAGGEDDPVRALIAGLPWQWPDDIEAEIKDGEFSKAWLMVIPNAEG